MHVTGTVPQSAPAPQETVAAPTPAEDSTGATSRHTRRFGLPVATALVMGNIIGGGIFLLPASVAPYGTVSLVAFGVLTVGAIALALVFGRLAERDPRTGGPYVYAREAFGDFAGFLAAWAYWITTWVSNAALAVAAVGYLDVLIPVNDHRWTACLAALTLQWLPALANFAGTRYVGAVQIVSTVLKFVPLLLVAVGGLFFFDPDNLGPFHASGGSVPGAVSACAALLLFSYLGVESAAVSAGEVKNARRNVGRATIIGTTGAALVYLLGTLSVFGTVAHDRLVQSTAPFSDAVNAMFGGTWGGWAVALAALVSMTGCLNGWTLLSAQTPYAAARDGLFPAAFARRRRGVPTVGVGVTVVLASLLTVYNYTSGSAKVFEILVLVTTFTATVPYLLATAAQIFHLLSGRRELVDRTRLVRDAVVTAVAAAFSMWLVAGAGYAAVYQGVLFLFAGVIVYAVLAARRQRAA
ncbi:transporter [Streptomyces avermitilis]|uniref:Amino acid transporter n=2 Tax=Streptomyces avermitilis TaxID=33903 RepID=Q82PS8_STRAW|nr:MULTISPECIES: amino acid permease [Streptomyces]KUN51216.1 transporter [Streptomyces avermitilis]MYS96437.1 amino acid permease [Streptomyces sp. SID5469]OOV20990.1 transporter [Streptomyces avermitilis]BAC68504.1 putative amino acid transporter [Streptomyces avermitilis MA-4680 = NBRC 14893]BBJ48360.1 transporter [Streptomyces avermitilis]